MAILFMEFDVDNNIRFFKFHLSVYIVKITFNSYFRVENQETRAKNQQLEPTLLVPIAWLRVLKLKALHTNPEYVL